MTTQSFQVLQDQLQAKLRRQTEAVEITTQQLEDIRALLQKSDTKK